MAKTLPGNTSMLRTLNRSLVLDVIRRAGSISRAEIARTTQLTNAAVGMIVGELAADGYLTEQADETQRSVAGRRPVAVSLNPEAAFALGVNVGVTKVTAVLADVTGRIRARTSLHLGGLTPGAVVATVARAARTVTAGVDRSRIAGAGVGLHGIVNPAKGLSVFAPHFGWRNVPITGMLEAAIEVPVVIENGVRTMLLGEYWFGAARGMSDVACVAVGAGIGAGFLSGGSPLRGPHGAAGEIGHTTVEPAGLRCKCGNYGCLETVASGPAIVRNALRLIKQGHASVLTETVPDLEALDMPQIAAAAGQGDAVAARVLQEAGTYLGVSIANLCNILDIHDILLGGGVAKSGPVFLEAVRASVTARLLDTSGGAPTISTLRLGDDASPLGGATLAFDRLFRRDYIAL